jgi:hypothetical protein
MASLIRFLPAVVCLSAATFGFTTDLPGWGFWLFAALLFMPDLDIF